MPPTTGGSIENRDSTLAVRTGSLNSMSMAVSVWATRESSVGALSETVRTVGARRSTVVAL